MAEVQVKDILPQLLYLTFLRHLTLTYQLSLLALCLLWMLSPLFNSIMGRTV